ncbi:NAD(+)/NADH kinase [Candidatus Micrarchaeota archaeon]|nr:NAD(+)/NADH kinase [Candidatus Micrarchaeota archaeon]
MLIKILANPKKQWAKDLAKEAKNFLSASPASHKIVSKGAEVTLCIGGDGTILYANHEGKLEGKILAIGAEKSYICQLNRTNWKEKIFSLLGQGKTTKIMTLEAQVNGKTYHAINDFVIHATHYRVAEIDVEIVENGVTNKNSFEGDGLIVSSSIGSTGYAYSAGGEKLTPIERKIAVVPICPYKRAFSGQVLSETAQVNVIPGNDCAFILDGIFIRKLKRGENVRIKKSADLIFFEGVG